MEDKELYSFFKEKSSAFNESPDDALWEKIESGINTAPFSAVPKPFFTLKSALLLFTAVLVTGIAAWVAINTNREQAAPKPQVQKTIMNPVEESVVEASPKDVDAITAVLTKSLTADEVSVQPVTDTIKKKKIKPELNQEEKPVTVQQPTNGYIKFMQTTPRIKDTVLTLKNIKLITNKTASGTIVVEVKDKLPKPLFDSLKLKLLTDYKAETGSLLVLKAPGFEPFRSLIKIQPQASLASDKLLLQPEKIAYDTLISHGYYKGKPVDSVTTIRYKTPAGDKFDTIYVQKKKPAKKKP